MGGHGSGSYQAYSAKTLVEDAVRNVPALAISLFVHKGGLRWHRNGGGTLSWHDGSLYFTSHDNLLTLVYRIADGPNAGKLSCVRVKIVLTHPYYGGYRLWFQCPTCGRRCAKLYRPYSELAYSCRVCCRLNYASTRQYSDDRIRAMEWREIKRFDKALAKHGRRCTRLISQGR